MNSEHEEQTPVKTIKKPRITKKGTEDQRSVKNAANMSHARKQLQEYIRKGKGKGKGKEEEAPHVSCETDSTSDEDLQIVFADPGKVAFKDPFAKNDKADKLRIQELEEQVAKYHSELSRVTEKKKKLKKVISKKTAPVSAPPPPPPPPPSPVVAAAPPSLTDSLRKKFLLRF